MALTIVMCPGTVGIVMSGVHLSLAVICCRFAIPVSSCHFHTLMPLRIFLLFTTVMEQNFLTQFLQNNGILQQQNSKKATEEWQRNGGNQAQVCVVDLAYIN